MGSLGEGDAKNGGLNIRVASGMGVPPPPRHNRVPLNLLNLLDESSGSQYILAVNAAILPSHGLPGHDVGVHGVVHSPYAQLFPKSLISVNCG